MIKGFIIDIIVKIFESFRGHSYMPLTLLSSVITISLFIVSTYYTSIQNFNETAKQWEKYNKDSSDMKYSSLYWQYPVCKENPLYKIGVFFLNEHEKVIQKKGCIVIEHCYERALGGGPLDEIDCSEEEDAIKTAIASISMH